MKKFKEYLSEEIMPFAQTEKGFVGIDNGPVRDNINLLLANVTEKPYSTPYHALEAVRRVLASFHIALPATNFLDGDSGQEVFPINQFGSKVGMTNDGQVVTKDALPYYVYFEYELNEGGAFDIFCEIVDEEELQDLINDLEEDEATIPERDAADTFDEYKVSNVVNEQIVYRGENKDSAKRRKIMSVLHTKKMNEVLPAMHEERLDEISRKTATSAYAAANDPSYYHPKSDKILKHIERKFGSKAADDAETHAYTSHFGRGTPRKGKDSLSGGLRQYGDTKLTKAGKIPKGTQKAMKNRMDPNKWQGYGRKVGGPKGHLPEENLQELKKSTLASYIKKASHDVATKSAATGRYADRANKARDKMKKGDYSDWQQGKKDDEFADKMFKKSWKRREGIAKAVDKLVKESDVPFDNPTETPSTPYKNPAAKARQLARAYMKNQIQKNRDEENRLRKSLKEK